MSLAVTQPPAAPSPASQTPLETALLARLDELGRRLDETRQELKADIQSKLPSSRRFSWVLLFIAVQVVQGIIVVRYTVRAASTALDSANIPEMTARYSEGLRSSQELVRGLNANVSALSELVANTSSSWKEHVQGFVHELPRIQDAYQRSTRTFSAEAATLPARIVDRFFADEQVRAAMAAYGKGVTDTAATVQKRSDDGIAAALKSYEGKVSSTEALAHFEAQVEKQFDASKSRIADAVADAAQKSVASTQLKDKLDGFFVASLQPDGWLAQKIEKKAESVDLGKSLHEAADEASAQPFKEFFTAQLKPEGPLGTQLTQNIDKLPLRDIVADVVKSRVNVTLAALSPAKGPVVLTCK